MRVQNIAQPRNGQARLVKILPHLGEAQDRLRDTAASMLKATSSPTVRLPSMTALAPKKRTAAVTSLLTSCTPWLAQLPRLRTRKLART
jgi:hypothetical protein